MAIQSASRLSGDDDDECVDSGHVRRCRSREDSAICWKIGCPAVRVVPCPDDSHVTGQLRGQEEEGASSSTCRRAGGGGARSAGGSPCCRRARVGYDEAQQMDGSRTRARRPRCRSRTRAVGKELVKEKAGNAAQCLLSRTFFTQPGKSRAERTWASELRHTQILLVILILFGIDEIVILV